MLQIGSCEVEGPKKDLIQGILKIVKPRADFDKLITGDNLYSIRYEKKYGKGKNFYQHSFTVKSISKDQVKVKDNGLPYWPLMTVKRDDIASYSDTACVRWKNNDIPIPRHWIAIIDDTVF